MILGAGPAGCMAAIHLARAGAEPVLLDRDATVGDALCGGFLSWRTAERLRAVGIGPLDLRAYPVTELALYAGRSEARASLPSPGFGLSRRALDNALRRRAVADGARLIIDTVRSLQPGLVIGEAGEHSVETIFLATGKHDVRGHPRPRAAKDPALGIRIRLPASDRLRQLTKGRIELHLFRGGYAGIVMQDGGSGNVCLAVRKSLLAEAGGSPRRLLDKLAASNPHFAERMAYAEAEQHVDTVGSVPYGYVAGPSGDGLWRIGDQAAVIPSLAGEGMAIAMASGEAAARSWLAGDDPATFQARFAERAARSVRIAGRIWQIAEREPGAHLLAAVTRGIPSLARAAMALTRI